MPNALTQPAKPYAASRQALVLTLSSVLAPASGLLMEMVLAWRLGASGTVDAFRIATLLLAIGTQLFFGTWLPHVLVPMFSEYRARGVEADGWRLAFSLASILALASLLFAGWVWFDPDALVDLLGPGLAGSSREDARILLRHISLALPLMAVSGVAASILAANRVFWQSALAQLLPNLSVVLMVLVIGGQSAVGALALGMLLGYALMLGWLVYGLVRSDKLSGLKLADCLKPAPRDGLKQALRLSIPLFAAIFISQWGAVVINRALSTMPAGTLAEFGYAFKLLALTTLLPTGLATVIFPAFSDAHAGENRDEFSRLATRALRMTLLLTLPVAAMLYVERAPIVALLMGGGVMSLSALSDTGRWFGILLVAAPAGALFAILSKVAFSMQDTSTPTVFALISAAAIALLVPQAAETFGADGVMWAFSSISWTAALSMAGYQIWRHRIVSAREMLDYLGRMALLSAGTMSIVSLIRAGFESNSPITPGFAAFEMIVSGLVFVVAGYGLSRLLGIQETSEIGRYVAWQLRQMSFTKKS